MGWRFWWGAASFSCKGTRLDFHSWHIDIFVFYSPILSFVFPTPNSGLYPFAVVCKGCHQNIPAPVETMPDTWIIAACPLCEQQRRYLPADIFQGRLSHELLAKPRRAGGEKWGR